ncbi:DUF4145 domain-containing protein [Shinella zoogloeoides]|uniref:DUF4145 domain-containing protein n=1 Tax=Shinella zoogloeoides TaxID=352475 RepID=UPI000E65B541|nr:DUF4145 domain-containing protein [Shinella zoogloeoides]
MKLVVKGTVHQGPPETINLRCPFCRHAGAFGGYPNNTDILWDVHNKQIPGTGSVQQVRSLAGLRRCPNFECGALVFVASDSRTGNRACYPPELIDFDATALPDKILSSLQEAVACHAAGAFKACALMVRRVLEELCEDKAANGANLKARIAALKGVAVIPDELLAAADELRILGNDAAHVEAKDYDKIGEAEAALAVDLAKELLKAVYQYSSLVARLKALKRPSSGNGE